MKIRQDFVTNSSSSSFVITNYDHPGAIWLQTKEDDIWYGDFYDVIHDMNDNSVWCALSNAGYEWTEFLEQIHFNG